MALLDSTPTSQTSNHASAAGVLSSQTNPTHHSALYTGAKIAGVILCVILCALIVMSAQASSKAANDAFEAAAPDLDTKAVLESGTTTQLNVSTNSDVGGGQTQDSASVQSSTNTNTNDTSVQVSVNGEDVSVPANGSVHKTIINTDGTTTEFSATSSGNGNNYSSTSTNLNVSSNSFTSGSSYSSTYKYGTGVSN